MSSLSSTVQDVFNEPGCGKNQGKSDKERKKGCTKQLQPGAAAGGCAFDGAKIALQPITDVAHLVHGPIACEGNSWDNRGAKSSGSRLYRTGFTTDINETDVVFGGEKRLFKAIREVIDKYDPPAVFVYQTCIPALTGDDIDAVCKAAREKFGRPVIPINAPGFVGSKNLGNKLAGEALLEHVIGTEEPEYTTPYDINIIGEYNLSGELWQIKPLLDELGIRILACISGDAKYSEVAQSHRARAAMMVCSKAMINVTRKMEERYGIPIARAQDFTTFKDGQSAMSLHVLQGERDLAADCRSLARFDLRGIPPLAAGAARIQVLFQVDADGLVSVSATEQTTGVAAQVVVKPSYGLSDEDITRMLADSLAHAGDDAAARILAEQKVEARRLIEATRAALNADGAALLDDAEIATLLQALEGLESTLAGNDSAAITAAKADLERLTDPFAARRMDHNIRTALAGRRVGEIGG